MAPRNGKEDADCHIFAATVAACINFPLWRASAIAQSGFKVDGATALDRFFKTAFKPPFRGTVATIGGMAWARAAIFYGSDFGKEVLNKRFHSSKGSENSSVIAFITSALPPLVCSTLVQVVNMPLIRSTITIQNPSSELHSVRAAMMHIYHKKGVSGLWHGLSAGVMKTVPKYMTAVVVKDIMEELLPRPDDRSDKFLNICRAAVKSTVAGLAGATLTNPFDVLRNEMFKTDLSLTETYKHLRQEHGWRFLTRGLGFNIVAVCIPVTITIFVADVAKSIKHNEWAKQE